MQEVDKYLDKLPEAQKKVLQNIRQLVKGAVPEAEESISYGIPAFKYKNKPLIYYAGFKDHLSIFPTSKPIAELDEKLVGFKISKGTIHFTLDNMIPDHIITELVMARVRDINGNARQ